jgi:hypothetical protein
MFDEGDIRGGIALHDKHAIGLQLATGRIHLYPYGQGGWMVGIRFNVSLAHYRAEGSSGGFMELEHVKLLIPAPHAYYVGNIEGWDHYKTDGTTYFYKPVKCQLLPNQTGFVTFAWLDAWGEVDPWFYFGWALRTDHMAPVGYRWRTTVAYMGVNYPIDVLHPSWVEIPPAEELEGMMQPRAPAGQWRIEAKVSGFTVDSGVAAKTELVFRVWEGRRPYHKAAIDFVPAGDRAVGKGNVDWSGINWGTASDPGELRILTGGAKGYVFQVVGSFFTGKHPPPGYPPYMWFIVTHPDQPPPSALGVTPGDQFLAAGPFKKQVFKLAEFHEVYSPGTYPAQDIDIPFSPIL